MQTAPLALPAISSEENQHLIFQFQDGLYASDALAVREIHWLPELTPLAEAAFCIVGVLNLRGRIVPVMDISLLLGRNPQPYRLEDCIIVMEHEGRPFAVIVHEVQGVQTISPEQIEPVPPRDRELDAPAPVITGIAKLQNQVLMLLSPATLLYWSQQESAGTPEGETSHAAPTTSSAQRFVLEDATPEAREIFHQRAQRLLPSAEAQTSGELSSVALVTLHDECYGIDLKSVREFCELRQVSPVPCCPPHVIGQMNLRGDIVTIIDIQPLLQLPPRSRFDERSVVGVVQSLGTPVGIVVDGVSDVLYLSDRERDGAGAPHNSEAKYFEGNVLHGDKLIYILSLTKILSESHLVVDETV
jgi:purine-binding chemotaxis protein CheW